MLRFILNGNEIENPIGWDDISLSIKRDLDLNFVFCAYEGELTFFGQAFNDLYNIYKTDSFCQIVPLIIEYKCENGNYDQLAVCNIIISDCEFNIFRCECKAKIVDNTWGTRINNNKNMPYSFGYKKTKNGFNLVPPAQEFVNFFTTAGAYTYIDRIGFSAFNCFQSILGFITDNNVTFVSDYFSTGAGRYIYLFTGSAIKGSNSIFCEISFNTLYLELHKKLRLGMMFYIENGTNYVRIENADYFYEAGISKQFDNVKDILISFDLDRLYSTIVVGSTNLLQLDQCDNGNADCTFGQIPFYTWDREEVAILDKECNIDKKLDLLTSNDIVIDSNVIENILLYNANVKQWDDTIFFVSCELSGGVIRAIRTDFLGIGSYWYNDIFTNKSVLYNWFSGIGNIYSTYLQNYLKSYVKAAFLEEETIPYQQTPNSTTYIDTFSLIHFPVDEPLPFSDDFNLWRALFPSTPTRLNFYAVPFTANYFVECNLFWDSAANPFPPDATPQAMLIRVNGGGTPFITYIDTISLDSADAGTLTDTFFCQQGDLIMVMINAPGPAIPDIFNMQFDEGTIEIYATIDNTIPPQPTEEFLGRKVSFEKFVSYEDLKDLKNNPIMKLNVNQDQSNTFNAWISNMNVNVKTLQGKFSLTNK